MQLQVVAQARGFLNQIESVGQWAHTRRGLEGRDYSYYDASSF